MEAGILLRTLVGTAVGTGVGRLLCALSVLLTSVVPRREVLN